MKLAEFGETDDKGTKPIAEDEFSTHLSILGALNLKPKTTLARIKVLRGNAFSGAKPHFLHRCLFALLELSGERQFCPSPSF